MINLLEKILKSRRPIVTPSELAGVFNGKTEGSKWPELPNAMAARARELPGLGLSQPEALELVSELIIRGIFLAKPLPSDGQVRKLHSRFTLSVCATCRVRASTDAMPMSTLVG